jgi:tripartite-type tricarboxylate transporter receptor subunit TctC
MPMLQRRALSMGLLTMAAIRPATGPALAAWPERNIRVVVPFSAGGNTDVIARIVAEAMATRLGRPFVVENRAGGGGALGAEAVARAAPDGYTLLAGSGGTLTANPVLQANLSYDAERDFAPIGLLARVPNTLIVGRGSRFRDLAGLLAEGKGKPGTVTIGMPGIGTTAHLGLELLNVVSGAQLVLVPYRGGGALVGDLIASNFDAAFVELSTALPLTQDGQTRVLAVAAVARAPQLPAVPTFIENGIANFTATSFTAFLTTARSPVEVIGTLHRALLASLADPQVQARVGQLGAVPATPEEASPEGLASFLAAELGTYRRAAALAGLRPQ